MLPEAGAEATAASTVLVTPFALKDIFTSLSNVEQLHSTESYVSTKSALSMFEKTPYDGQSRISNKSQEKKRDEAET